MTNDLAEQVQSFTDHAARHSGEAESLEELLRKWRADVEEAEVTDRIRESHGQALRGEVKPAAEVFANIRRQLGIEK